MAVKIASAGFDSVAPVYDALSSLVFGRTLFKAATEFINRIPSGAKVLILGGGTGKSLFELLKVQTDVEVWYVEPSPKMLGRAKRRVRHLGSHNVHFILGTHEDLPDVTFDVVMAHFFLDLFSSHSLPVALSQIQERCSHKTTWLVADFVSTKKWWDEYMLKIMYYFFVAVCHIEARRLPPWRESLVASTLMEVESKKYHGGFIESSMYVKSEFAEEYKRSL